MQVTIGLASKPMWVYAQQDEGTGAVVASAYAVGSIAPASVPGIVPRLPSPSVVSSPFQNAQGTSDAPSVGSIESTPGAAPIIQTIVDASTAAQNVDSGEQQQQLQQSQPNSGDAELGAAIAQGVAANTAVGVGVIPTPADATLAGAQQGQLTSTMQRRGDNNDLPAHNNNDVARDSSADSFRIQHHEVDEEAIARFRRVAPQGRVNNLVLMIQWADSDSTASQLPTVAQLDPLFNGDSQSVRDVWRQYSYGQLNIVSSFTGWIQVSAAAVDVAAGASGRVCRWCFSSVVSV